MHLKAGKNHKSSCGIETVALDARDLHKFAQDAHCANLKCTPPRLPFGREAACCLGTEFGEAHPASLNFFEQMTNLFSVVMQEDVEASH